MRIRSYLLLVALVAGVPGLIVGALLMWWSATLQKHSIEVGVRDTARALALAVDRELFRARAIARTIAASREIDSANFAALHQQAADMSDASGWVTLLKRDGEQVINALRPYGSPIPRAAGMANIDNVFAKSEVVISNLFQGAVAARPIITVAAPVIRDGKVLYAAQFSFGVEQFQELLSGQDLSAGWVATIQDRNGITIARSPNAERWVGKPASATFATALERAPEGVGRGTSRDGTDMLFAWATSEESGWKVAVGAPVELIDAPLWRMSIAFGIAALFVIAGMVAAFVIARRVNDNIAYSVKRFSEAAIALGHGAPLALHENRNISEIEAARKSLLWASEAVQKRVADEERARREAVAANQAKDEFIATLAHEVRTPLSAIATITEVLDRSRQVTSREIAIVRRQVQHLSTLVNDLFDAGRVAMNKFVLIRQPMNLADAIGSCVAALDSEKTRASLTVDVSEVWIDGDETRIQQIISNLLTNAIKFTPSHGTIRVSLKQAEGQAILQVSDTGLGIPSEIMPHIFDLFVQGERADGTAGGMGIGLALVRRLVELHGGNVKVHSEGRGKGSTFTVSLPAIDAEHQASSSLAA